jgi:rsbT antagonist protein RsbS
MTEGNRIPIIKIWDIMLVSLQGEIGDAAAQQLVQDVLERVQKTDTMGLVLDVTGLWLMDSHLCSMLSRLAASAALMGVRTIISGISPDNALTLQLMGLELRALETVLDLERALERLGVHVAARESDWNDEERDHEGDAYLKPLAEV